MHTRNFNPTTEYAEALRTQKKSAKLGEHIRPYPNQTPEQPLDHVKADHSSDFKGPDSQQATTKLQSLEDDLGSSAHSTIAIAGDQSALDIGNLNLESATGSAPNSPPSERKRTADDGAVEQQKKARYSGTSNGASRDLRLLDCMGYAGETSPPHQSPPEPCSELLAKPVESTEPQSSPSYLPARLQQQNAAKPQPPPTEHPQYDDRYPGLLLQPDSRSISQQQLASEVKSIYAGLAMVENKCIHVDRAQAAAVQNSNTKLPPDHWQALIALHRTLLHEHHDFFLASQHPSASIPLRGLAAKYSMPARMWKHGIHSFLEILRRRLPESMDYMLGFIYLAYQMMALLYETVPAFADTWIECLGDLGRYRMAIEDEDVRDRDTWAGVALSWYTKAADRNPITGRLYHHLAILARPNALQQMYYYSRSLTCVKPFGSTRESIMNLLDPILGRTKASFSHVLPIDACFIKSHGLQFLEESVKEEQTTEEFFSAKAEFLESLSDHIGRVTAKWKDQGVWIAVTNIAGWFDYGVDDNALRQAFLIELSEKAKMAVSVPPEEVPQKTSAIDQPDPLQPSVALDEIDEKLAQLSERLTFKNARLLFNDTFALALRRVGDENVLSHVNMKLSFVASLASSRYVSNLLDELPWADLIAFLNELLEAANQSQDANSLLAEKLFPADGERSDELPLPEDYLSRGLIWTHGYFPKNWFDRERDVEERHREHASTVRNRINRTLRLGRELARYERWISYDADIHCFKATSPTS